MLKFVLGRQGYGKTDRIYEEIYSCIKRGEDNLILIVPEQYTLQAEKEIVEKLNIKGMINLEVLSFSRLTHRILNEVGGLTRTQISKIGRQMIIQKILFDNEDSFEIYKSMITKQGFVENVSELLSEFKKRLITTEDLNNNLDNSNIVLNNKIHDINLIYHEFNSFLGTNYLDNEESFNLLIEKLNESELIKKSKIWIDGFHTFTKQTLSIINLLINLSQKVTVSLTVPKKEYYDNEIFQISKKALNSIKEFTDDYTITYEDNFDVKKPKELIHLEKEIYSYPYKKFDEKINNITINQCKNIYSEIDVLCMNILMLVQEKGYRWREICVVTNDLDTYSFLIKRTMEEYNIPNFIDIKRNISNKPLSILIINILKIISFNFRYEDIFGLLKTDLTELSYNQYEILENYILRYGIKGSKWLEDFYKINEDDNITLSELNGLRKIVIEPIIELRNEINKNKTFKGISEAIYKYLKSQKVDERIKELVDDLKKKEQYEYAAENAQIWNNIITIFDEIVNVFGNRKTSVKEYLKIIKTGINSAELAIIPTTLDQVLVGDITRTRSKDIKALFVVGANEGVLPKKIEKEGIFSENENSILKEHGIEINDDYYYKGIQESFLIYNTICKTKNKLFISYPLADYEGASKQPSVLIGRFIELFPKILIMDDELKNKYYITNPKGTLKHLICNYRKMADGLIEQNNHWDEVYNWYYNNIIWRNKILMVKNAFFYSNTIQNLSNEYISSLYGTEIRTSITRLEQFSNCPHKFFVKYGLKPEKRKIFNITMPDIGQLLHEVISKYTSILNKKNKKWSDVSSEEMDLLCNGIIDEFVINYKNGIFKSNKKYKYLINRLKLIAVRAITILTYHFKEGNFDIFGNEITFGENKSLPPFKVALPDGKEFLLEGRIDRIDKFEINNSTYLKIIDYKTGNNEFKFDNLYYGLSLQLIVYLWVCLNYGKSQDLNFKPAGMFYFKLDNPMIKSGEANKDEIEQKIKKEFMLKGVALKDIKILKAIDKNPQKSDILNCQFTKNEEFKKKTKGLLDEDDFNNLIEYSKCIVNELGKSIIHGDISIKPIKINNFIACQNCTYDGICQFDTQFPGNNYDYKRSLNDDEVLELLKGGVDYA